VGILVRPVPRGGALLASPNRAYGERARFLGVDILDEQRIGT
jgi:hypothetical protein